LNFIGFYWTLPVPWAGFTVLPTDPDEAAKVSRTIRYQVERVRRWVKDEGGQLIREDVFLEIASDRGSEQILPVVDKLISEARKRSAQIVLVDFSEAMRWRRHGPLWDRLDQSKSCIALDPVPLLLDGKMWNPISHFRAWREIDDAHNAMKPQLKAALTETLSKLKAGGASFANIAENLNSNGVTTMNGKPWTGENVRKLLAQK
jgi:hypothetical protein